MSDPGRRKNADDIMTLARLARERDGLDARIRAQVGALRQAETPWSVIGRTLGISKQAAQQKYGASRVSVIDRPLETP